MQSAFETTVLVCVVGLLILTVLFRHRVPRVLLWLAIPASVAIVVAGIRGLMVLPTPPFLGGHYPSTVTKPGPVIHGSSTPPAPVTKPSP